MTLRERAIDASCSMGNSMAAASVLINQRVMDSLVLEAALKNCLLTQPRRCAGTCYPRNINETTVGPCIARLDLEPQSHAIKGAFNLQQRDRMQSNSNLTELKQGALNPIPTPAYVVTAPPKINVMKLFFS
jgi:hypothetical protein